MEFDWPRELSEQDMRQMIDLMNTVAVRETTLGFYEPLGEDEGLALMRSFAADLRRGAVELLLTRDEKDGIVGMVTLAVASLPARRHIVEMRRCVVDPAHRGTFLLEGWERALTKAADLGCSVITLEVRDDGPKDLWRRLGFRSYGLLPDYARVAGRQIDGHFMYALIDEVVKNRESTGSWFFPKDASPAPAAP